MIDPILHAHQLIATTQHNTNKQTTKVLVTVQLTTIFSVKAIAESPTTLTALLVSLCITVTNSVRSLLVVVRATFD